MLAEEDKAETRRGDLHAQRILAHTDIPPAHPLLKLHHTGRPVGTLADGSIDIDSHANLLHPWSPFDDRPPLERVLIGGVELRSGSRVRLGPQLKAGMVDTSMQGKIAIIEAIEQDLEDNVQLAVVLEDDPGSDSCMLRQPGYRFFFHPDEVAPLA